MKRLFFSFFCLFCFLFSLLFPQICISSALLGIRLWFSTLLPSLFPAMVLSSILVSSGLLEPPAGQQGDHNRNNEEDDCQHIPLHQSPAFPGPL